MYLLNGKKITPGHQFVVGEGATATQYPHDWLERSTPEDRAAVGIVEVADPARPDDGLYDVVENQDGSYTATPKPLAQITTRIWDAIKTERDRRTQAGGYQAGGKWFHSDTFSRTQQLGLVMLGAGIPPGTMWKTMDGSFIEMTPALAQQVFAAAAAQDLATFAAAEAHKAAMEAAADPAAYDFSGGWPAVFGG